MVQRQSFDRVRSVAWITPSLAYAPVPLRQAAVYGTINLICDDGAAGHIPSVHGLNSARRSTHTLLLGANNTYFHPS